MLSWQCFVDECDDIREFMCLYTPKPELDQTGLKHVFRDTGQVHVLGVTQEFISLMFSRHS